MRKFHISPKQALLYCFLVCVGFSVGLIAQLPTFGHTPHLQNLSSQPVTEAQVKISQMTFPKSTADQSGRIDINRTGVAELDQLPGIGKKTAERIIRHRIENGDFFTIEDLMSVPGIGEKQFEKMKDRIRTQ